MSQMKELYNKVAKDAVMQQKFSKILAESEEVSKEATTEKLVTFAKDAGYAVSMNEIQEFFSNQQEKPAGELDDAELDLVAGGKIEIDGLKASIDFGFCIPDSQQWILTPVAE